MNHSSHLKQMLIGAGVLFVGMLLLGIPLGSALPTALLLACPLMMMWMMMSMSGSNQHGGGHHDQHSMPARRDSQRDAAVRPERTSALEPR